MRRGLTWKGGMVSLAALAAVTVGGMGAAQSPSPAAPAAPPTGSWPSSPPQAAVPQAPPPDAPPAVRGAYLSVLGDCAGCHTAPNGQPFAGGLPLNTPFGIVYSSNITPDRQYGIGGWSAEQFRKAMQEGRRPDGAHLYPAMPYPYYSHASAADIEAIRAYLMSLKAVNQAPPGNRLMFPFNLRFLLVFWNWLNFRPGAFQTVATQTPEWNRGAYLVDTLGHCGACHTPKNMLFGDKRDKALQGGELDNWFAPNLNGDARNGLKTWSVNDITSYLRTGANDHAQVSASMQEVVEVSTSKMSDGDLRAIAVYLKGRPASGTAGNPGQPSPEVMQAGQAIYVDQCAACHAVDGSGAKGMFPPLRGNPGVQQTRPTTALHAILAGAQTASTPWKPTSPTMPGFAWKLNDAEIAAVATYVRNSWGNAADPVSAHDVAHMRGQVAKAPIQRKKGAV